jgi:hypothetical protein
MRAPGTCNPGPGVNKKTQLWCLWSIVPTLAIFTTGWILGQYLPPPAENSTPLQLQAMYLAHTTEMRIGANLMALGAIGLIPFLGVVVVQVKRMEGERSPIAYACLLFGALTVVIFYFPLFSYMAAVFRPHHDPEIIQALQDVFWIPYAGAWQSFGGEAVVIGILALRADTPLPRWYGYLSFWCCLGVSCDSLGLFFKTGPFAFRGFIGAYGVFFVGYVWFMATLFVMNRAIRDEPEPARSPQPEPERVHA